MRAIGINVAANTTLPGFRGPIYPDGSFLYVPIPEREPVASPDAVPTYADIGFPDALPFDVDADTAARRVHFDPEFADYFGHERYTYGDEHGVKAGPLTDLAPGDSLLFYATLTTHPFPDEPHPTTAGSTPSNGDGPNGERVSAESAGRDRVSWRPPEWGAYVIGEFRVAEAIAGETVRADPEAYPWVETNAHSARETFDASVLVRGTDDSQLFDRAVPLSAPDGGATANRLVTELSNDSGRGPWWRRVLRFDADATERLRSLCEADPDEWLDEH